MKKDIALKWIKALRSGKFKQGKHALCEVKGKTSKYCCLGVLCHILKTPYTKDGELKIYEASQGFLPSTVTRQVGIKNINPMLLNGEYLTDMNDVGGKSFKEIANVIEDHYEEL